MTDAAPAPVPDGAVVLDEPTWRAQAAAYATRVEPLVAGRRDRARRGETHPVDDFLFTYYPHSPTRLARWHPGAGVLLAGDATDYLALASYRTYAVPSAPGGTAVGADLDRLAGRVDAIGWIRELLVRTASRTARLDCFGLHEWAMVYRQDPTEVRHASWPLRLGPEGTDAVVERHRIRCTHVDAYRFFTDDARDRNAYRPTRETQQALEQPGCLHAGMDLYKWATKLVPFGDPDRLLDCFVHARDAREIDMRAAPYDLRALGYAPIRIEEPDGKAVYVREQRALAERAEVLRSQLVATCDRLLAIAAGVGTTV